MSHHQAPTSVTVDGIEYVRKDLAAVTPATPGAPGLLPVWFINAGTCRRLEDLGQGQWFRSEEAAVDAYRKQVEEILGDGRNSTQDKNSVRLLRLVSFTGLVPSEVTAASFVPKSS
ncbi:Hypothetical protein UVM_LOCUS408 [uncultured virus]|nr:Hypothetical protein UVM_LOCUS408 [uncultured virus]